MEGLCGEVACGEVGGRGAPAGPQEETCLGGGEAGLSCPVDLMNAIPQGALALWWLFSVAPDGDEGTAQAFDCCIIRSFQHK